MEEEQYLQALENAVLDAAATFGGGSSPVLERWMRKHAPVISKTRIKHGKPPGAAAKFQQEKNTQ